MVRPQEVSIKTADTGVPRGALVAVWDEFVGLFVDDGLLAVGIVLWVAFGWLAYAGHVPLGGMASGVLFAPGLPALLSFGALRRARA